MKDINEWAEAMLEYRLPRWRELPEFELYMDQVLDLLDQYLNPLFIAEKKSSIVTATMINNYVKQNLLSKPEKRKYNKKHLASIIAITILKRILTIPEISQGIEHQKNKHGIEVAYDTFCATAEQALHVLICRYLGRETSELLSNEVDRQYLTLSIATIAFAGQILTEKVLYFKRLDLMNQSAHALTIAEKRLKIEVKKEE